ncbi:HlyD family efflux transporter periplasmic adaptor subunit [Phycisphaeraceae bacterium D3-23]
MPQRHAPRLLATLFSIGLALGAAAQDSETPDEPVSVPDTATVTQGGFIAQVRAEGRYAADAIGTVAYEPEQYSGELVVAEVVTPQGRVSPGSVVIRLEAPDMAERLEDAERALKQAEDRLRWAQQEREMSEVEQAMSRAQREQTLADYIASAERWEAFGKEDAFTSARLSMESTEASLADATEELRQLEQLYEGARLASRTQDIVLERSRRRLAMQQTMAEISRRNHDVTMNITLPNRDRDMAQRLERQRVELRHAELRLAVARERQAIELDSVERAVETAREAVTNLQADAEALALTSDTGGVIVNAITLKPGDNISARQTIATLQAHDRGSITMSIDASALRTLREGDSVDIRWRPFGEVATTGTVRTIAWQGSASGNSTTYAVTIDVNEVADVVRPGMLADITATREIDTALSVPASAVARDDDGPYVMLQDGDTFTRRAVVTGASNADQVQIIQGLEPGDTVRVPAG